MNKIYFKDLRNYIDKEIELKGFVDSIRNLQWVQFLILKDSTGKVQVTIEKSLDENKDMVNLVESLTLESTVTIKGILKENPKVKLNGLEFIPQEIEVTSESASELPINIHDLNAQLIDQRLDYRFLDLRNDYNANISKIQTELVNSMRKLLLEKSFTEIHTPKLIGAASESGSEVFEVKYFDRKAYLAQSPQFYKQMAICAGFDKVFETGPVFRAENSNTNRHTTEFTGFDVEFAYLDSVNDVMDLEEELLTNALKDIHAKYHDLIKETYNTEVVVPTEKFPRITLSDLYKVLEERYNYKISDDMKNDTNSEVEKLAYQYAMDEYNSEFIFITDFPTLKRPFYHHRNAKGLTESYDLIWKGIEITTGAVREHRYQILKDQATEKGLTKDVEFYLEFFKYGCPPHGGFGLGVDRLIMLLLDLKGIKESMFLFRGPNRLEP